MPKDLHSAIEASDISWRETFQPYQVVTYMFTHDPGSPLHIIFNMFVLWMFGRVIESVWGAKKFLIYYLACGLGAAAVHLVIQYFRSEQLLAAIQANNEAAIISNFGAISPALGASGAVMGVMVAFAMLFPNQELLLIPIPIPIKAKWLVLAYALIDLIGGLGVVKGDNIAHFAHLGGALTGFILVMIWRKNRYRRY